MTYILIIILSMTSELTPLTKYVVDYGIDIITGFEMGMYSILIEGNVSVLTSNNQPLIKLFAELHEKYYTATFNLLLENNKQRSRVVVELFENLHKQTNHSIFCILKILANLFVSVHFNIDRNKLIFATKENYGASLKTVLMETFGYISIDKLFAFDHDCNTETNHPTTSLKPGEKFITITIGKKPDSPAISPEKN